MELILFYIFAGLSVGLGVVVVTQKNPVSSAIALVGSFFGVAGLYVLMHAHFIAVMQLLLYAGAIMVFFVFVLMLLNLEPKNTSWREISGSRLVTGVAALFFAGVLGFGLWMGLRDAPIEAGLIEGSIEQVGTLLLSKYVVPFEILSITLMVAVVGAVVMGKKDLKS